MGCQVGCEGAQQRIAHVFRGDRREHVWGVVECPVAWLPLSAAWTAGECRTVGSPFVTCLLFLLHDPTLFHFSLAFLLPFSCPLSFACFHSVSVLLARFLCLVYLSIM